MLLNFKEAFTFMFKDEKFWQKYFIGTLPFVFPMLFCIIILSLYFIKNPIYILLSIPIFLLAFVSFFLLPFSVGYCVNYANKKILTGSNELPEWKGNFINFYVDGITLFAACLIFSLGINIVMNLIWAIFFIFIMIFAAIASAAKSFIIAIITLLLLIFFILICIAISVVGIILIQLAQASFIVDKNIMSIFNIKRIKSLVKDNVLNIVLIYLTRLGLGIIIMAIILIGLVGISYPLMKVIGPFSIFTGILITFVVAVLSSFYTMLVIFNLLAQYVQIGTQKNQQRIEAQKGITENEIQ